MQSRGRATQSINQLTRLSSISKANTQASFRPDLLLAVQIGEEEEEDTGSTRNFLQDGAADLGGVDVIDKKTHDQENRVLDAKVFELVPVSK